MKKLLIRAVKFYQKRISPIKGQRVCRFIPTCSSYAIDAYELHGAVLGTLLAFWRILRCNPFNRGKMIDYVPEKFLWSKNKK